VVQTRREELPEGDEDFTFGLIKVAYQPSLILGPEKQMMAWKANVRAKQPTPVRLSETVGLGDVRFLLALIAADAGQNDYRANQCLIPITSYNPMHVG
jgi:hypothetical protein